MNPIRIFASFLLLGATLCGAEAESKTNPIHYRKLNVQGTEIFYREAGLRSAPAILLLHGFPTSSQMFRDLIPRLAGNYRVIAPDYPGYGQSAMPERDKFEYSFAHFAKLMEAFTNQIGLETYSLYVMDYGAPVGYRLALAQPERVKALIVQNGNAYEEGLRDFWIPIKKYWKEPNAANRDALRGLLELDATRWQYNNGVKDPSLLNPDTWMLDQAALDLPRNKEIQLDLFYDYRTNVPLYPKFQAYFRQYQPPTLIVWGKNDAIFPVEGAYPYQRDLPRAELHLLDTGHFALETHAEEIATKIKKFLDRNLKR